VKFLRERADSLKPTDMLKYLRTRAQSGVGIQAANDAAVEQ